MYIEGGDLGYNHAPGQSYNFGLWAYLHTQWVNDGGSSNNVSELSGEPVWPAAAMNFGYPYGSGPDAYVDEFAPMTGAKLQFNDQIDRGRVISFVEVTRGYRTYTSAVVHGAFIENGPMSTQDRLMERIVAGLVHTDTEAPAIPGNIAAQNSGDDVILTWDAVSQDTGGGTESVDSYMVQRKAGLAGEWTTLALIMDTQYTDSPWGLGNPMVNYIYRIQCIDTAGNIGDGAHAGVFDYGMEIP